MNAHYTTCTAVLTAACLLSLPAVAQRQASGLPAATATATAASAAEARTNPLLQPSPLPLRYPPFDRIQDADFAPALDQGMAQQLREVAAIADNPAPPSFDSTVLALERSGQLLARSSGVFFTLLSVEANPERRKLQATYAPLLAAHRDAINLNSKLFARVQALYDARATLGQDAPGVRLIERYHQRFVRAGAQLSDADKARLRALNGELATLATRFEQNVLGDVNNAAIVVDSRDDLAGLSDDEIATTAAAARARGLDGKWVIALLNTTDQPLLAHLRNRALRERLHKASVARNSRGDAADNTAVFSRTMQLRAERAQLLGYANHAAWVLDGETAKTPAAATAMLRRLAPASLASAQREAAQLQALIDREQAAAGQPSFKLEPWDWSFYSERLRLAQYGFDATQLKPYLELNNVLENGVFYAAGQLYGLRFVRRTDLPAYNPDLRVYDVFNADGSPLAIFVADLFARPSKRGGAWMNAWVGQNRLFGAQPVVSNNLNIPRPPDGQPALLTWDEVNTLFHEFGHALHGMFSNVDYPLFSGAAVERDFVEYPSQVNEMWADWPQVLAHYARHHQTGEPMPRALLDKFLAAGKFNQGFATLSYLSASLLDQSWHQLAPAQVPAPAGVMDFEARALHDEHVDFAAVPPRYRTPYFSHIMGGYSAGYYAYIWAEVLDADTVEWFKANGGLTRANGDRFRARLLSQGGSRDSMALFRDMVGHEPRIEPLLERRGLNAAAAPR